jgi:hypothetical protein
VSPTAIGTNSSGSTTQQAKLLATVTDANGNPVTGATVAFNRIADPSGGNLSQASATTDSGGQASVQYIAGASTTGNNGVQIKASVLGNPAVTNIASLTVNQSALFIALGTGNVISNLDEQTYKKDWTVYVTDANGVAVPNIDLTIKVLPIQYMKGVLTFGTAWTIDDSPHLRQRGQRRQRSFEGLQRRSRSGRRLQRRRRAPARQRDFGDHRADADGGRDRHRQDRCHRARHDHAALCRELCSLDQGQARRPGHRFGNRVLQPSGLYRSRCVVGFHQRDQPARGNDQPVRR